jgi:hypothetical protein
MEPTLIRQGWIAFQSMFWRNDRTVDDHSRARSSPERLTKGASERMKDLDAAEIIPKAFDFMKQSRLPAGALAFWVFTCTISPFSLGFVQLSAFCR